MQHPHIFAKLSSPRPSRVYHRNRLFKQLDESRSKPVIWISAPAGSGKTTLVSSYLQHNKIKPHWFQVDEGDADIASFFYYLGLLGKQAAPRRKKQLPNLTPEYLAGLPIFTRNFFRELYDRIKPPGVLVFDNFQDAGVDIPLHQLLPQALAEIPDGINVVIISRFEPPPSVARMRASGQMTILDQNDLRLSDEESIAIGRLHVGSDEFSDAFFSDLNAKTEGWVTGLVLAVEHANEMTEIEAFNKMENQKLVFDYFAGELFDRLDQRSKELLLHTAYLPKITSTAARNLAKEAGAEKILADLNRRNYFTTAHNKPVSAYQFHPLFREFLKSRAQQMLSTEELDALLRNSAQQLEQEGQTEQAIELLIQAQEWERASTLILQHAPKLIEQGRYQTLSLWLKSFPPDLLTEQPWLSYWMGVAQLAYNPSEARKNLEVAYQQFKSSCELPGQILSWCAIIDTYFFEFGDFRLDKWVKEMDELLQKNPSPLSPELQARLACAMFIALMFRQPYRDDLGSIWEPQVRELVLQGDNLHVRVQFGSLLLFYYLWIAGDPGNATLVFNTLGPLSENRDLPPLIKITWQYIATGYYLATAQDELTIRAANKGLKLADETGIRVCETFTAAFAFYTCIARNDNKTADTYLNRVKQISPPGRFLDIGLVNFSMAYYYFNQGRLEEAKVQARLSLEWAEKSGAPYFVINNKLANTLFSIYDDEPDKTYERIEQVIKEARANHIATIIYNAHMVKSELALENGDQIHCVEALKIAFSTGRECDLYSYFWWRSESMSRLFAIALTHGIESEYVRETICKRNLLPPDDIPIPDTWPFPVKIYTLGRFSLLVDDKPVVFKGKTPKKALELLKALIAFGGRDVSVEHLCDALWPDAEGDAAYQSFTMALQRLRKVLAHPEAIVLIEGKLTLNPKYVWVDVWSFERGLATSEPEKLGEALRLYQNGFLEKDPETSWALSCRENLHQRFLNSLSKYAKYLEQQEQAEQAIVVYERGLEVDPLAESFYQGLMRCHLSIGQHSEARRAYERCKEVLKNQLDVAPTQQTQALNRSLQEETNSPTIN